MSGTQFQLLKDSKVNENISRDLMSNADKALPPDRFLAKKKGESKKEDLYDHEKTVLKKKKASKKPSTKQGDNDDTDERQIKSEIDYSDKNSYYAPSLKQGRRSSSSSTNRSQLSKANVKAAFGGNKSVEGSVSSHKRSKSSAYSRPTTSAAMSVVSSTTYYSITDSKRSYNTEESIVEGSEEEDDNSDNSSNASDEEEKRGEEIEEELAKAEK